MTENLYRLMADHVAPDRLQKIENVSSLRTRYISVVLEDVFYTQNISAVMRSLDCLGIQELTLIGATPSAKVNKHVAQGAGNWVDLHRRQGENRIQVINELKKRGYRIAVTSPHSGAVTPYNYDLAKGPTALVLGNEMNGISEEVMQMADEKIAIPMYGFTESFNISVSAAIILSEWIERLNQSSISWKLSTAEAEDLAYRWIKSSIKFSEAIEAEHVVRLGHPNDQA